MINKKINFGNYLYNRLPEMYRREDAKDGIDFALKRYLEVLDKGGLQLLFGELLTLYDLFDVDTCPKEVLPLISRLLGYNFIDEVDEFMQRKIVSNLVEIYKRKGTKSVIDFITREFTHFDTKVVETQFRIFKTWSPKPKGVPSSVYVEPRTLGRQAPDLDTCFLFSEEGIYNYHGIITSCDAKASQVELLNRLLREFLPVYCNLYIQLRKEVETYSDTLQLQGNDQVHKLTTKDIEDKILTKVANNVKVKYNVETENVKSTVESEDQLQATDTINEDSVKVGINDSLKDHLSEKTNKEDISTNIKDDKTIAVVKDSENPNINITFEYKGNTTEK